MRCFLIQNSSLSLSWENKSGAIEYQLQLSNGSTQILLSPWDSRSYYHLNSLSPGSYTWKVKAKNPNGESAWSTIRTFKVSPPAANVTSTPQEVSVPYIDAMDSPSDLWTGVNWTLSETANHTENGSFGWKYDVGSLNGYDNNKPNQGYLTSPVIAIPQTGLYFLRYFYRVETESQQLHWDQRWMQISVNGGAYQNVDQLSEDPTGYWLQSRVISLAAYSGQQIRIRFYFSTLDSQLNQFEGWAVDDFSISTDPPPSCQDADNSPAESTLIQNGQTVDSAICPGGDVDYYQFNGASGDQVGIRIKAQSLGSPLDTLISLFDSDASSPLAINDDIVQYERTDSYISYHLARSGTYYIKVQAWDHPNAGSENARYAISLFIDNQDPDASFITPQDGKVLPNGQVMLNVAGRDTQSGISLVRFYWHSGDWLSSGWNYAGEDWEESDGWNYLFDTRVISSREGAAVYAVVFDWAGNWVGTGAWNLGQPMLYLPLIIRSQ